MLRQLSSLRKGTVIRRRLAFHLRNFQYCIRVSNANEKMTHSSMFLYRCIEVYVEARTYDYVHAHGFVNNRSQVP